MLLKESPAQTHPLPAATLEAAKKEGQVVFYTPLNINDSRLLLQRFEQRYPFIKTELLRLSAEPLLNRIFTEDRAGRNVVDVINNTMINPLKKARLLQPYRSPEHAAYLDSFKDSDGYWASVNNNYYVVGYNSRLVSAKDAPTDWQDLLNPKWKGKVGMDQEEYEWFGATLDVWGRERALKYHRALAQQEVQWRKGHTLISQLIAAGEFPVGIVYAHRIESMKKAGAPVEWAKTAIRFSSGSRRPVSPRKRLIPTLESCCSILCFPTNHSSSCAAPIVCRAGPISSLWCLRCTIVN